MFSLLYAAPTNPLNGLDIMRFLPFILIFIVFYFLIFKPQNDKAKQQKEMQTGLKVGDKILLNGGILGKVSKLTGDEEVLVEIAEGVKVRCLRSAIMEKKY